MERQVMGITWLTPPFIGGIFMACSTTPPHCVERHQDQDPCPNSLWGPCDEDVGHRTRASDIQRQLLQKRVRSFLTHPIGSTHPTQHPVHMRALVGFLLLSIALSVLSSASRAQALGRCEPSKAVKIIDAALLQGKTLQQAMDMMIKAKVFDGSKTCITLIRESSMNMREPYPKAFKMLWMN